jgi:hypothetical protein
MLLKIRSNRSQYNWEVPNQIDFTHQMKDQIGEQGAARLAQIMGEIESPKKKTKIPGAKNIDGQK